jgi:SAM-dependent methyltransferase
MHAIHTLLYRLLEERSVINGTRRSCVADLGCGVGATMEWFCDHAAIEMCGITLSPVQAELAATRLKGRGRVVTGSYTNPEDLERLAKGRLLDAAYMIESFVHGDAPDALLAGVAARTRPGGLLLICDDFPTPRLMAQLDGDHGDASLRRMVADFRRGWHIHTFLPVEALGDAARRHGWQVSTVIDLSPYVVTDRPRDLAARMSAPVARLLRLRSPWWQNVVGGSALQRLGRRGLLTYQVVVFERAERVTDPGR